MTFQPVHGHIRGRMRAGVVALVAGIVLLAGAQVRAQTDAAALTVQIEAPAQVAVGALIQLRLTGAGMAAAGGFETLLLFDPNAAEYAGLHLPTPPAEQIFATLLAPELPMGSVAGFYTCATDPCRATRAMAATLADGSGEPLDGDTLAIIKLIPLQPGRLEIKLADLQIVDRSGARLAATLAQPTLVVQVGEGEQSHPAPAHPWASTPAQAAAAVDAAAADVTGDGVVEHADVMETALAWQILREGSGPCSGAEPAGDLNRDGCVDVVDVQTAAALAGTPALQTPELPNRLFLPQLPVGTGGEPGVEAAAAEATWVVNSTGDEADANLGDGICRTAVGTCTLRAAIGNANQRRGWDTINFAIPGSGVKTIQLNSRLPTLWDTSGGTWIAGYTQPGARANSDARVSNAQIRIQLRGQGASRFDALAITSANNGVRGLAFFNFNRSLWVYGAGAHDNVIAGNFIGTNAAGTFGLTNLNTGSSHGVHVEQGAHHNRIGGTTAADRNVISGNARHGIGFWHWATSYNLVYNNIVGLSPDGQHRLRNMRHGIDMNYGASYNTIGGTQAGQRNLVSGNAGKGVEVSHGVGTKFNEVIGNYIGTDATGNAVAAYTANEMQGVTIKDRANNNLVAHNVIAGNAAGGVRVDNYGTCCPTGNIIRDNRIGIGSQGAQLGNVAFGVLLTAPDSTIGPGNIIAYNPVGIKVEVADSDRNTITRNSIFANTGLGIDLGPAGVANANDAGDGDTGPNQQLNWPVIEQVTPSTVAGRACANCTVEVFIADRTGSSYWQGRTFAGSAVSGSNGLFSVAVSGVTAGRRVVATATDSAGNTSEFSPDRVVQ